MTPQQRSRATQVLLAGAAMLAASALFVRTQTRRVEREHPPHGQFMEVDGVRLHYLDRGEGEVLVLLHGNATMALDFDLAGLVDEGARTHRVIAFDRPGFGYSDRPRDRRWTPEAQAELIAQALRQLGVERATVLGHSWGTLVAIALGLQSPELVQRLVLVSGYYYPTPRLDAVLLSPPALPVLGTAMRHTVAPIYGRMIWPLMLRKVFGPGPVPDSFKAFPKWLALRPSQLRAAAGESAGMVPAAARLQPRYQELQMPVTILAGTEDRQAWPSLHSERLHRELPNSTLTMVAGEGHMLQHLAPGALLRAAIPAESIRTDVPAGDAPDRPPLAALAT